MEKNDNYNILKSNDILGRVVILDWVVNVSLFHSFIILLKTDIQQLNYLQNADNSQENYHFAIVHLYWISDDNVVVYCTSGFDRLCFTLLTLTSTHVDYLIWNK